MNWFKKISKKFRKYILICAWLPLIIAAIVIACVLGGNSDAITTPQAIIILITICIGLYFTIGIILVNKSEKPKVKSNNQDEIAAPEDISNARYIIKNSDGSIDVKYSNGYKKHYTSEQAKDLIIESTNSEYEDNDNNDIDIDFTYSGVELPIFTKIVGVTFGNCQENIKSSQVGDNLMIKHTPISEYPESTTVINTRTNQELGHIKKELAVNLVEEFGENFILIGTIVDITSGKDNKFGCNIQIISKQ